MILNRTDRAYIQLAEANPCLIQLVNTFDLTNERGEQLPDFALTEKIKFSLFWNKGNNTRTTIPRKEIGLEELYRIINSEWLKSLPKVERPYITPYGTFSQRNNEGLKQFNGDLIALDYDKLSNKDREYLTLFWESQPNTILSLISPSGNGLKVLIRAKHSFTPETLYNGLKHNSKHFEIGGVKPDLMQFVLSQPLFIPYSENAYFNPYAKLKDYGFTEPLSVEPEPVEYIPLEIAKDNQNRVNQFFINRVNINLRNLEQLPRGGGFHRYLYSVLKRLFPYINQQTAISETELIKQIEEIIVNRYGNREEIPSFYRSLERAKYPEQNLIALINKTAKIKI